MIHLLRLLGLIILGSVGGFVGSATVFPAKASADRFALWPLLGAVDGAYLGIGVEMAIRLMICRKWKFSVAEALVAMTMLAVLLVVYQVLSTAYRAN